MKSVPIVEVKAHLSALLDEVERGQAFAITRHGRVVARLVPGVPRMAAELFRPFRDETDEIDFDEPIDSLPEPVVSPD